MVHDEHWLALVGDLDVVLLVEVLGDTDVGTILELKEGCGWRLVESDVLNDVSPFVSVVRDDTRASELSSASILELVDQPLFVLALEPFLFLIVDFGDSI